MYLFFSKFTLTFRVMKHFMLHGLYTARIEKDTIVILNIKCHLVAE